MLPEKRGLKRKMVDEEEESNASFQLLSEDENNLHSDKVGTILKFYICLHLLSLIAVPWKYRDLSIWETDQGFSKYFNIAWIYHIPHFISLCVQMYI